MSEEEMQFLPYEEAIRLVGAIQEEEDIDEPDHRILTVYSLEDKELCWFDFDEVMRAVGVERFDDQARVRVTEYIARHLPTWVLED
ncbi:MAG: hypothetical protein ACOX5Z_02810 [Desulfobulbus sp.]|jgi:hypothetical protein